MKKYIWLLAALCLLLSGCTPPPAALSAATPPPTQPTEKYTPYFTDTDARLFYADVAYSSDAYPLLGRLNNVYNGQAAALHDTLAVTKLTLTEQSVPYARWVRVAFSKTGGQQQESFTIYENDFVVASHPTLKEVHCTAPSGTYKAVLGHLETVMTAQRAYFSLQAERINDDGYHAAGYTLYDENGKEADVVATGQETPILEMVGEDLVRVTAKDTTRLYHTATGQSRQWATTVTDVAGDRVAVAVGGEVTVQELFATSSQCRLYVAATEDNPNPVRSLSFSADGESLHIGVRNAVGTAYDYTAAVQEEIDGGTLRMLGDWQAVLTEATEKEEQQVAYNILKKLRHKESELGYTFSGVLKGHLQVGETDYLLCELGHWLTDEEGGVTEYETVAHLMVPSALYSGYLATIEDNEIRWDTANDWFKK